MTGIKTMQGVTNIYDSSELKDFNHSANFPIAWEVIFANNDAGKEFTEQFNETLKTLSKDKYQLIDVQGTSSDMARSIECAFTDSQTFQKVVHGAMKDIIFYSEEEKRIQPKQNMIDSAKELSKNISLAI